MDFNQLDITALVNRFWEGNTTLEEEDTLKKYFAYREVPEKFQAIADYFALAEEDEVPVPGDAFDEKILALTTDKPKRTIMRSLTPWLRVASMLVLAASVWFAVRQSTSEVEIAQEPTQQEIRAAFEQTRNALMFMSGKMKEGTSYTQKLDKINTVIRTDKVEPNDGK